MILFLTKDLMIQSNASSAARQSGAMIKAIGNLEEAMTMFSEQSDAMLLVDLQTPGLDVGQLLERLSAIDASSRRAIAFAQHVEVDLIEQAQGAGFEAVMTRGQFSRNLPGIVKEYATGAQPGI